MKLNALNDWYGLISLVWVSAIFGIIVLLHSLKADFARVPEVELVLLYMIVWWGIGLLFAVSGVREGQPLSRFCAVVSMLGFAAFVHYGLLPVISRF